MGDVANETGRRVSATLSGSAAEAAGLRIGDVVMSVDGIPCSHLDTQALRRFMRGPVGSSVDLVVHRSESVRFYCFSDVAFCAILRCMIVAS